MKSVSRSIFLTAFAGLLLSSCSGKLSSGKLNLNSLSDTGSTTGGTTSGTSGSTTGSTTSSTSSGTTSGSTSGTTSGSSTFSCTATPSSLTVNSGGVVSVTVAALNGTAPYSIPQFVSSFSSQATISPTKPYTNSTSGTIQVTRTVTILDNAGLATSCNFTVNVQSQASPSLLGCAVTASPASPIVGQPVTFTVTAVNGSSTYTFSNFVAEAFSSGVSLTQDGSNTATATYTYNTVGARFAYASVTSGASTALCSAAQITVRQPKLEIVSNPTTAVADVANPITITVTPKDFASNAVINFNYSTTESGVSVSASNNVLTVRSSNGEIHNFSLVINAAASTGETASVTVPIKFTANTPVCLIVPPVGQKVTNVDYRMDVLAQNGDPLEIYEFNPTGGLFSRDSLLANVFYARWLSGGDMLVDGIKVRSKATKALCNGDGRVAAVFANVKNRLLGCSVSNGSGISKEGDQVAVTASLSGGVGPYNVTATSIGADIVPLQPNQVGLTYFTAGAYTISVTVVDLFDNSTKTCQAQQTVTENSGIMANLYNTYSRGWSYRFNDGITNFPFIQSVVMGAFHIFEWNNTTPFPGTSTKEWFVVEMKSRIRITAGKAGNYTFKARVDDGIRVMVDGTVVVFSDDMQPATNVQGSTIYLSEGMHDLNVAYYNGGIHQTFNLQWAGPTTGGYGQIPADILFRP